MMLLRIATPVAALAALLLLAVCLSRGQARLAVINAAILLVNAFLAVTVWTMRLP